MKKIIFYEIAKHSSKNLSYREKERWKKMLKYVLVFGVVSTLAIGGLAVWGTVVVVEKIAGSLHQGKIQESVAKGQVGLKAIASKPLTTQACLDTVGGMISPTKLLTVPLTHNIESLRRACWDSSKSQQDFRKES